MKFVYLLAIACFAGIVAADDKQDQMDQLADQILGNLMKSSELNPIHLHHDYEEPVHERFGPIDIQGRLKISKGVIYGFDQLKRHGHCDITNKDGGLNIAITMLTNNMTLDADVSGHLNILPIGFPDIPLIFHIGDLMFDIDIAVGGDAKLHLVSFKTDEIDNVTVWPRNLDHFPFGEAVVDAIEEFFVQLFNRQVRDIIDQVIKPILEEELKNIHI